MNSPHANPVQRIGNIQEQILSVHDTALTPTVHPNQIENVLQEMDMNMEDLVGIEQGLELAKVASPNDKPKHIHNRQSSVPIIKQTPSYLKTTVVGQNKLKGRTSNQTKRSQEAMASIEIGSQTRLEELLASKKHQVSQ